MKIEEIFNFILFGMLSDERCKKWWIARRNETRIKDDTIVNVGMDVRLFLKRKEIIE